MGYSCKITRHRLRHHESIPETTIAAGQPAITEGDIARLAYSYWEARGKQGGSAVEDWQRAERELLHRYGKTLC